MLYSLSFSTGTNEEILTPCRVERGSMLVARSQPNSILFCFLGESGDLARLDSQELRVCLHWCPLPVNSVNYVDMRIPILRNICFTNLPFVNHERVTE